ncbi:MAG: tRNA pseudouridine(55) synthase TruB [Chitinophagaceae bacterium]|nr:tRNA pseudouridine(55) synthase TruB [Chitinophagaceae bacterium]
MKTELNKWEAGSILLIDKPYGWTSFDIIRKIRKLINIRKVGHAGTLDPLATGLLIVCTGKMTKRIQEFMSLEKEYQGIFTLGATTPTYDLESSPENFTPTDNITRDFILQTAQTFIGDQLQLPPAHSAVKVKGKRLYELARAGIAVQGSPRKIRIDEFDIGKIEMPEVHFRVVCSSGTYIRSLAHDFGKALGCGAYLSALCRTRIGSYRLEDAFSLDQLEDEIRKDYNTKG